MRMLYILKTPNVGALYSAPSEWLPTQETETIAVKTLTTSSRLQKQKLDVPSGRKIQS